MGLLPPKSSLWTIRDNEISPPQILTGDFEADGVTRDVGGVYGDTFVLGKQFPITQFLHGKLETLKFRGRFFNDPSTLIGIPFIGGITGPKSITPKDKLKTLINFSQIDPGLGRPPLVLFQVGEEDILDGSCLVESVSNIIYDRPLPGGEIRGVTFDVSLRRFTKFEFKDVVPAETRYHNVKQGEYYELLSAREYNTPLFGVIIRQRQPTLQIPKPGTVVKLPSKAAISSENPAPTSVSLKTLTTQQNSDQRIVVRNAFKRKNVTFNSLIIPNGL